MHIYIYIYIFPFTSTLRPLYVHFTSVYRVVVVVVVVTEVNRGTCPFTPVFPQKDSTSDVKSFWDFPQDWASFPPTVKVDVKHR